MEISINETFENDYTAAYRKVTQINYYKNLEDG